MTLHRGHPSRRSEDLYGQRRKDSGHRTRGIVELSSAAKPEGVEYDSARTLQERRQLRQKYPEVKLLWSGDWSTFSPSQRFWVTVAGIAFDDSSGALAWCRSQGLDFKHLLFQVIPLFRY
jgi:hypothetical protein